VAEDGLSADEDMEDASSEGKKHNDEDEAIDVASSLNREPLKEAVS
jgi:hypothetical protein